MNYVLFARICELYMVALNLCFPGNLIRFPFCVNEEDKENMSKRATLTNNSSSGLYLFSDERQK